MMDSFAEQAATSLIKNSLMVMMQQDKEKLSNARRRQYGVRKWREDGPAGVILGPVFAAAAFAGVMAFADGGIVPGMAVVTLFPRC